MFGVFKKHRILKLIGLAFGLFLLWFIVSPVIDMTKGQDYQLTEVIGSYAYGVDHWIDFISEDYGKMVSFGEAKVFSFTYDKGTFYCIDLEDTETSWKMKVLSTNSIYNCYDGCYLFRRNQG